MPVGRCLGVDVGEVRVGVAESDPDGILATPVDTLPRDHEPTKTDVYAVARLAAERGARVVYVGLPRSMSGTEGEAARRARGYARELAVLLAPGSVRLVDERLTTVQSHRQLYASGRAGRQHRAVVDQVAAVLILQGALDAERSTGALPGDVVTAVGRKPRTKERS
ncbi:MAG: Holliday junction resolvase RuvX [Actinomycetales bacterium]|nr:Holliday junction resolvase RuvX [Actinomycetales bacterium]